MARMRKPIVPKLVRWPFFTGNVVLLGLAVAICLQSSAPPENWQLLACILCVVIGVGLGVLPFLLEYRAAVKLVETEALTSVVSQVKNLEQLTAQIGYATSQWQVVRESSDKTVGAAKEIARDMATEIKAFNEFLQRANEDERAMLRLEVEKLRRGEADWVQVLVRMLDHVFALHQAALRSRQPGVAEQTGRLQTACHDVARRVGLTPFVAAPAEPFDAQRHQLMDGAAEPPAKGAVEETVASGYTFQGRLIRPALVRLCNGHKPEVLPEPQTRDTAATAE
jgi:molecular chaperone GrpE (heat shock protein)